jgi:Na+/H+ antiporter NhaD/arsenite permease-like protein
MLLSIAVVPLINSHFWEKNLWWISIFVFTVPMALALYFFQGPEIHHLFFEKVLEYISFILLLATLYVISGGIHIAGTLSGSPSQNVFFLFTGSLIASVIGTTGASMLLIRPLIRANKHREKRAHVIVFFIFLVSNIGGILTPLGDPPLFLGYLQGVPFEWTLNLFPHWAITSAIVLVAFYAVDVYVWNQENGRSKKILSEESPLYRLAALKNVIDASLAGISLERIAELRQAPISSIRRLHETLAYATTELESYLASSGAVYEEVKKEPILFMGKGNFFLLAGVVASIYLQGMMARRFPGVWPAFGPQEAAMALLLFISLKITPLGSNIREENGFNFGPIKEVALIFAAIFTTMIPALYLLEKNGAALGISQPWQFFWLSGTLSSFLDNAPTYLTFLSLGKALGLPNDAGFTLNDGGSIPAALLTAISCGSVFMGANTYIGNGPNFMVRSIAESQGIKMPSFFGYMLYSILFLVPVFVLITFIFFL